MKDLSIYFKPIHKLSAYSETQLGYKIIDEVDYDTIENESIAILFVSEYRNSTIAHHNASFQIIQNKLYQLEAHHWSKNIYNLGEVSQGLTQFDTYIALKEIIAELVKNDIIPIVIGGSQDLTYPIFQAYEKLEQTVNLMSVDAEFDLGEVNKDIQWDAWLNKIIVHKPNYLFNYTNLGFQSYYINLKEKHLFDELFFDYYSLGEFYTNNKMVEPLVRNTDILTFDLNAIRSSDYKANTKDSPHGFYGEDACRIMRYAGLSDKLTSLGLFNFSHNKNTVKIDANLVAQMIWYFIEGVHQRKNDYPKGSKKTYTKYRVAVDDFKDEIVFYKSDKSGRWWIEVPYPNTQNLKFQRHLLVPCTYETYQNAVKNDIPNLWWKTYQKLV
ncbi:MAG TPA: arginase [Crocinitomix sp.]|nr:arginase [Crocinitomix sp.]